MFVVVFYCDEEKSQPTQPTCIVVVVVIMIGGAAKLPQMIQCPITDDPWLMCMFLFIDFTTLSEIKLTKTKPKVSNMKERTFD